MGTFKGLTAPTQAPDLQRLLRQCREKRVSCCGLSGGSAMRRKSGDCRVPTKTCVQQEDAPGLTQRNWKNSCPGWLRPLSCGGWLRLRKQASWSTVRPQDRLTLQAVSGAVETPFHLSYSSFVPSQRRHSTTLLPEGGLSTAKGEEGRLLSNQALSCL